MDRSRLVTALALLLAFAAWPAPRSVHRVAAAEERAPDPSDAASKGAVVAERLRGEPVRGRRITALDRDGLTVDTPAGAVRIPFDDLVTVATGIEPDPRRGFGPREVEVDLWTGEVVHGELRGGDAAALRVESSSLGAVSVALDRIAGVRFLRRLAAEADPPELRSDDAADILHLSGGDRFTTTIESFGDEGLSCVTPQKARMDIAYERLVALRMVRSETQAARGRTLSFALRDGSRIAGDGAVLAEGRVRVTGASGGEAAFPLADVVAVEARSDRFAFLSDIPPASVEVKTAWPMVAGDPAVLFAPRMDRSFSGKALRCGGRGWLDGIGVFSGTTLRYDLDGKWSEFRATVGLDDGAGRLGGVVFVVRVDGKEVWTSGFVRSSLASGRGAAGPIATPRIPLVGAKSLELSVLGGDAEDPWPVQDEADWLGALLVRPAPAK